ncbi:potassium transporter Kef [Saccharospirillum sp. MSK14-1]|uniref:cation:proton antiporter family protein n=1 Tax=Saccharospirillum sp. MSK14-1 TaxID=1897632 RepID=UPI000D3BD5FD|nr:cation:proton antiporter family protein [Saccharospirillum sp. MSK14-1]PTY35940.1 potassium transporter Kef [Saccharospirillum sp. MSK14-1]
MDFLLLCVAFVFGLAVKSLGLPPLVGYLLAGFGLHFLGVTPGEGLETLADLGITLMLFTIGLKLKISDLLRREVWAGTLSELGLWCVLCVGVLLTLASVALPYFAGLSFNTAALLAFAFGFSSTVCIVKLLEESGEMRTRHGRLAIGVLVMQDVVAVLFLVFATGKMPSYWAIALLALPFIRPLLNRLLDSAGHGELLPLTGFFLALGGYELFALVGVKGDLGALIAGMLLSHSSKATELSKALLGFKDLFLIGFFLSIGFTALPTLGMVGIALGLTLLLPLKFLLFYGLLLAMRLRGRTAWLGALALANYSEFGLIVADLAVDLDWLPAQWLVILALTVTFSFIVTSLLYPRAHALYSHNKTRLTRFERSQRLPEDVLTQPKDAQILVVGLGRVGTGAYRALHQLMGKNVWGMDADPSRIQRMTDEGMKAFVGDGEDADLWEHLDLSSVKLILLALPSIDDSRNVTNQLKRANFNGQLAAIARYEDERLLLMDAGIDKVFNFYTEAGTGFAEESLAMIGQR